MAEGGTRGETRSLLPAVFLSTFFIRLGFGLTLSIYAWYLGTSVETVGLTASASPIVEASAVLFVGMAADRYGRLPVLRWGLIVGTITLLFMSTTRVALDQTILSAIFGLTSASILAASLAVTGDVSREDERGLEMGRFDAVNLAGWVFGFALGYILVSALNGEKYPENLHIVFYLGAGAVVSALAVLALLSQGVVEEPHGGVTNPQRLKEALLKPEILLVVLPWAAVYMLIGALFTFLGGAATTYHIPPWELGAAVGVGGAFLLFTQPYYGRLTDRVGRGAVMMTGICGFLGVLTFGSLIVLYGISGTHEAYLGGIGISAIAALALGPSSLAALTDLSHSVSRGTTMALYSMTISGGMALGLISSSVLFNYLRNNGVVVFFAIVGALLTSVTLVRLIHERLTTSEVAR